MVAFSLGIAACNGAAGPDTSAALQAADSKSAGSTNDSPTTDTCKESTDSNGVPCKICFDSAGTISYDGCNLGGAGGEVGSGGGAGGSDVKCVPTTDPSTGAACKTCYAPDGSFTSSCAPPSPSGCVDASGKNLCGSGGSGSGGSGSGGAGGSGASGGSDVKCAPSTDPKTGAACQTCYAPDGSITSNTCSTGGGTGASCVAAPNLETGQICKVCSDAASGKLLFVDCGAPTCSPTSGTAPPAK